MNRTGLRWAWASLIALTCIMPGWANAREEEPGSFALGLRAGTLGWGPEATLSLASWAHVRGGFNFLDFSSSYEYDGIDYDANVDCQNVSLLLDLHPFSGIFRITGGLLVMDHSIRGTARPLKNLEIGGLVFTPEQVGTLTADIDYPDTGWYLGFGFGNAFSGDSRFSISFEVGVILHSQPKFSLSADGAFSDNPVFQNELKREERETDEDIIQKLKYWPVLTLGFSVRF
ncbi:MAG: hypothetical protein U1E27_06325 [Kiritimatiellia bacterium]|nr:hypothetical protein [Kiritimatiellia bacterium]